MKSGWIGSMSLHGHILRMPRIAESVGYMQATCIGLASVRLSHFFLTHIADTAVTSLQRSAQANAPAASYC